jgi:hypothetical protein
MTYSSPGNYVIDYDAKDRLMFGNVYHGHQQIFFENLSPELYMHQHSPKLDSKACCSSFSGGMAGRFKKACCQASKCCGAPELILVAARVFSLRVDGNRSTNLTCASGQPTEIACLLTRLLTLLAQVQAPPILSTYVTTRYSYRGPRSRRGILAHQRRPHD